MCLGNAPRNCFGELAQAERVRLQLWLKSSAKVSLSFSRKEVFFSQQSNIKVWSKCSWESTVFSRGDGVFLRTFFLSLSRLLTAFFYFSLSLYPSLSLIPSSTLHVKERRSRCSHVIAGEAPPSACDISRFVLLSSLTSHSPGSALPAVMVLQAGMMPTMSTLMVTLHPKSQAPDVLYQATTISTAPLPSEKLSA